MKLIETLNPNRKSGENIPTCKIITVKLNYLYFLGNFGQKLLNLLKIKLIMIGSKN